MPNTRSKTSKGGSAASDSELIVCLPRMLPRAKWVEAAHRAATINPTNAPSSQMVGLAQRGMTLSPASIAVLTTKYWGAGGVKLTVGFLDNPPSALRKRILSHMNAWAKTGNVKFAESKIEPRVRIARTPNDGYWSYVGTDVLSIPKSQPTMNLDSFSMNTPESEFHRVVRHETGHTMGYPHEHMRKALVDLIDKAKAIVFFRKNQGWDEQMTRRQVLTPIEESSLLGTLQADPNSIMCYQIPGSITKNGKPIVGGLDIDDSDYAFTAKIYPKPGSKPAAPKRKRSRRARR